MYIQKKSNPTANIIKQIAYKNHVTEEEVRTDIKAAMDGGRSNPAPEVQSRWESFHYEGEEPTPEEFILWVASLVMERL